MLIETRNLVKKYGEGETSLLALNNVNLSIARGEFVAVVGTSGSGKSTLLHLLGGLDEPTEGEVFIDGCSIYEMEPDELTIFRRRSVGFVFQSYNLIPILNVYENIILPAQLDNAPPDKPYIDGLISSLGLGDKLYNLSNRLSGGQQQRVAIARALSVKPQIVLADEPTGNLDSRTSLEVVLLLKSMNEKYSQTIVMVTHNEELAVYATRRIHIEDGKIISDSAVQS
jgi:putative ABC transport system ATP-binding protein